MEVNNNITQSLKDLVKDTKQGLILSNSMFSSRCKIYNETDINIYPKEHEDIVKREFAEKLTLFILNSKKQISKVELHYPLNSFFEKRLIVLEHEELKEVIEYCIRTMPEQAIKDIRNIKKNEV